MDSFWSRVEDWGGGGGADGGCRIVVVVGGGCKGGAHIETHSFSAGIIGITARRHAKQSLRRSGRDALLFPPLRLFLLSFAMACTSKIESEEGAGGGRGVNL